MKAAPRSESIKDGMPKMDDAVSFHVFVVAPPPGGEWTPSRSGAGKDGWATSSLQQEKKARTKEGYGTRWGPSEKKKI